MLNFALAYATPYMVNYGPGYANLQSKIFFIWFGCCFVCITFVYFFVYETKGLTLEEVDELYIQMESEGLWGGPRSTKWTPSTTFQQRHSVAEGAEMGDKEKGVEHSEVTQGV